MDDIKMRVVKVDHRNARDVPEGDYVNLTFDEDRQGRPQESQRALDHACDGIGWNPNFDHDKVIRELNAMYGTREDNAFFKMFASMNRPLQTKCPVTETKHKCHCPDDNFRTFPVIGCVCGGE